MDNRRRMRNWKIYIGTTGSIEINGKKIKSEDEKKYNDLHEKYFREPKEFKKLE